MNNLASLIKTADDIHISKKERKYLLQEAIRTLGTERQLEIAVEEIAELINVISSNILDGFDYMHTAEEITDVLIAMRAVAIIANAPVPKNKELDIGKKKMKVFGWYAQLSKAQQYITKYIRHGAVSRDKLLLAMNLMESATCSIIEFCDIQKKDISRIEALKYKRLQDRIRNKEVK